MLLSYLSHMTSSLVLIHLHPVIISILVFSCLIFPSIIKPSQFSGIPTIPRRRNHPWLTVNPAICIFEPCEIEEIHIPRLTICPRGFRITPANDYLAFILNWKSVSGMSYCTLRAYSGFSWKDTYWSILASFESNWPLIYSWTNLIFTCTSLGNWEIYTNFTLQTYPIPCIPSLLNKRKISFTPAIFEASHWPSK